MFNLFRFIQKTVKIVNKERGTIENKGSKIREKINISLYKNEKIRKKQRPFLNSFSYEKSNVF